MYNNQGYGNYPNMNTYGYGCGYAQPAYYGYEHGGSGYALVLVLFILLVVIGATRF